MIRCGRFNIYFVLALVPTLFGGCRTEEGRKLNALARIEFHMEIPKDATGRGTQIPVFRAHPVMFVVDKVPFLTESTLKEAKVVETMGTYALQLQFDSQGSMLLEQYTTANPTRHMAIFCQYSEAPDYKPTAGRWLGAPKINGRITNGRVLFTPDATLDETEQMALQLNNTAAKGDHGGVLKW